MSSPKIGHKNSPTILCNFLCISPLPDRLEDSWIINLDRLWVGNIFILILLQYADSKHN